MDPAQGESGGGRSLTSKIKARVTNQHLGSKVKNIKKRLPGLKKRDGGDEHEENSSEYDDSPHNSPRGPGPETRYNVGESTPFTAVRTNPASSDSNITASQNRDHGSRPPYPDTTGYGMPIQNSASEYGAKSRNHVPITTTTRPTSVSTDTSSMNMTPSTGLSNTSQNSPSGYNAETRNYVSAGLPSRQAPLSTDVQRSNLAPPADSPRSNLAPAVVDKFKNLDVNETSPRDTTYRNDQSSHPEVKYSAPSSYPDSTAESTHKGYNDVPRATSTADSPSLSNRTNKGVLERVTESVSGAAAVVGDKLGYYREDHVPRDPNAPGILQKTKLTLGLDKPTDPNAPSVLTKAKSALGFDKSRDPNAPSLLDKSKATLGLDKPRDPNAPPLTQKAKIYMNTASQKTREYSATAADRAAFAKDRLAAQTTPTPHDKELSEQITQTLSTLPGTIKEKILPVLGLVNVGNNTNSPTNYRSTPIVDRVTGAVSSLFAATPKETGEHLQHTFPAHFDFGRPNAATPRSDQEQPAAGVHQNY